MERRVSGSNEMQSLPVHPTDYYKSEMPDDRDRKFMDTSELIPSTVDSSSLSSLRQQMFPFFPGTMQVPSPHQIPRGKGVKKMKKIKTEDADETRSQSGDEEIDIEKYVNEDTARISVKILRKIIPKLRIACYFSDEQVSGKRKLKHLWDERPADWPMEISFKDPNNALKDTRKPGKDELSPMYEFLRKKYLELKSPGKSRLEMDHRHHHDSLLQQQQQQQQQQHLQQHQQQHHRTQLTFPSPVMTETSPSSHNAAMYFGRPAAAAVSNTSHGQSSDEETPNSAGPPQLVFPSMPAPVKDSMVEESQGGGQWFHQDSPTAHWQQPQQHPNIIIHPTDDKAMFAPTRPEHGPRAVMSAAPRHHVMPVFTGNSPQETGMLNGRSPSTPRDLPAPVQDLYRRLGDKQIQVMGIGNHDSEVIKLLNSVQSEVIDGLYNKLSLSETRLCLMFLDAGHQYEALLDVIVVLAQMDITLLSNGCHEIIQKFNRECTPVLMIPGVFQLRLPLGPLGQSSQLSVFDSQLKARLYGVERLDKDSLKSFVNDDSENQKPSSMNVDELDVFGINKRPAGQPQQVFGFGELAFIDKRNPATTVQSPDSDKKNEIDELFNNFLKQTCGTGSSDASPINLVPDDSSMSQKETAEMGEFHQLLPSSHQLSTSHLASGLRNMELNGGMNEAAGCINTAASMAQSEEINLVPSTDVAMECELTLQDVFDVISGDSPTASSSSRDNFANSEPFLCSGTSQTTDSSWTGRSTSVGPQSLSSSYGPQSVPTAAAFSPDSSSWSLQSQPHSLNGQSWSNGHNQESVQSGQQSLLYTGPAADQQWNMEDHLWLDSNSEEAAAAAPAPWQVSGMNQSQLMQPAVTGSAASQQWFTDSDPFDSGNQQVTMATAASQQWMQEPSDLYDSGIVQPASAALWPGHRPEPLWTDRSQIYPSQHGMACNNSASTDATAQCVPSATARNVAPIPSFVSNASFDDFDNDDRRQTGSGRRGRQPRGSTSSVSSGGGGGRGSRGVDRNVKRT